MHAMLGKLFSYALNETGNQDLHDRALLYYRLLRSNLTTTEAIFQSALTGELIGADFAENHASERINKLFSEFNTLAVVYGMPSTQFIESGYQCVCFIDFLLVEVPFDLQFSSSRLFELHAHISGEYFLSIGF